MPDVRQTPADFVKFLTSPGVDTIRGRIPLNQYMCKSGGNGGNDTATSLLGKLRWMTSGDPKRKLPTLNEVVGAMEYDVALKGQGRPASVEKIMNFIIENKEAVGKLTIEVAHREPRGSGKNVEYVKVVDWTGTVNDRYFGVGTDSDALKKMVKDKVFGFDCIGFVANYLIYVGVWDAYQGYEIDQWPTLFANRILSGADIAPLCIMIWPGSHIAIINDAFGYDAEQKTCLVDVCQSSSGGPQLNTNVVLKEIGGTFQIIDDGFSANKMPVKGSVTIHQMFGLRYVHDRGPEAGGKAASTTVSKGS